MFQWIEMLLASIVLWLTWYIFNLVRCHNRPPGPRGLPILGSLLSIQGEAHEYFHRLSKKYGNIVFVRIGSVDVVVLNDWRSISKALNEKDKEMSARPSSLIWKTAMKYTGIAFGEGPEWKEEKNFSVKQLTQRATIFEDDIATQVQELIQLLQEKDNQKVCFTDLFFLPIFNVIVKFLTGKQQFSDEKTKYLQTNINEAFLYGGSDNLMNYFPFLRRLFDYNNRHNHIKRHTNVENVISRYINRHLENLGKDNPSRIFIDAYLIEMRKRNNVDKSLTMQSLKSTCTNFFYGGVETVEATLIFAFLYFALWPEIQEKVRSEIDEVIGRSRAPRFSDHTLMRYTEATILEVHRFSTVMPLLLPHSTFDNTEFEGYTIPKDAYVLLNGWAVHHDEELWGDPETFRPDRFLDSEGQIVNSEYVTTFSKGLRICPGKLVADIEIFLHITSLLQRFSFHQATGETPLNLETITGLTQRAKPFHLLVKHRT